MGRLRGPPLLVQIVSVTEILRPKKLRLYKLTLWDGMRLIKAMAFAPTPYCKLGLYDLDLGYKVSKVIFYPILYYILNEESDIDAANTPKSPERYSHPGGRHN